MKLDFRSLLRYNAVNYWSLLIAEKIIHIIVDCTNEKSCESSYKCRQTAAFVKHIDNIELKAFYGLLYLMYIFKSNHEDVKGLFATDGTGRDIFRGTMSLKRFLFQLVSFYASIFFLRVIKDGH